MKRLLTLLPLLSLVQSSLFIRQKPDLQEYINSVCSPNISVSADAVTPPCISITNIQVQCASNGTQAIDYLAHAQCMCSPPSSFFSDWQGCQNCLFVHGARSQQDLNKFSTIISSASSALCTGTPTAEFSAIFSSVADKVIPATTGATILSDQFPSQSVVSLYYKVTGTQGSGAITGNATAATRMTTTSGSVKTASTRSAAETTESAAGTTASTAQTTASTSTSSSGSSATGTTSKSGAIPKSGVRLELLLAVAGGVIIKGALT